MADNIKIPEPEGLDEFLAPKQTLQESLGQAIPQESAPPPGLDEFIAPEVNEEKYGTVGQQLKTAAEGAASALTFGASTGLEKKVFGVKGEDIRGRREENPGSHMAGQAAGLIASTAIPGVGAANLLGKAGQGVATAVGVARATTPLARIGSMAVKGAVENALFQSGDEVSKMLASDDGHFSESAMADIGLASLIGGGAGGAFGSVSPLWQAAQGSKVGRVLKAITDKAGGVEGSTTIPDSMEHAIKTSGMEIAPEVRAGLSNDPEVQGLFKTLEQSDTSRSGRALQESYNKFRSDAGDTMSRALGREPGALESVELSKYESGKNLGHTLADEYHAQVDPLAKEFEVLKAKNADAPLVPDRNLETPADYSNPYKPSSGRAITKPGTVSEIADKIAMKAQEEGWTALPDSDIMREVNKVMKALPEQKTLSDLGRFTEAVGSQMQKDRLTNGPLFRAGGIIKGILRDAEASVMAERLGAEAPELLQRFKSVRQAYAQQAALKEALDSRLHAGGSTASYAKALREMASTDGERVIQRLSGVNDADVLKVLQEKFPKTAEALRAYHIDNIIKTAVDKAKPGTTINSEALIKGINKMSPELRAFAITPESLAKVEAVGSMLDQFNKVPHNFSNTARTVDKLMEFVPGSAVGMATMLMGHNPVTAAAMGFLTKMLGKDIPDAVRLATLKFLGSGQPVEAGAFKAAVDMIQSAMKGEALITRASKNVFKSGTQVLPEGQMPSSSDIDRLDKQLKKLRTEPEQLLKVGDAASHYLPEHGAVLGQVAARTVNYLNNLRPDTAPKAPLDSKLPPSTVQIAAYRRALSIAQQPLIVLDKVQKGTVTPEDIVHLQNLYPNLYTRLVNKLTSGIADTVSKGNTVPYKARIGLSMLMAQPLDSTLNPASIVRAQPVSKHPTPDQASTGQAPTKSTAKLSKMPNMYQTPGQAAEKDRANRG